MSSKDKLENVSFGSEIEEEIQDILRESFLDPEFESKWLPAKIQLVHNPTLEQHFNEKKQEFFVHGHKAEEMEEKFGFVVENNVARLEAICEFGLNTEDSEYNALGYNCMGIYVCRYVDVCLQHALVKYCGSNIIRLVICKYVAGRQTTAIPRVASAAEFIEPTQGYDSHVSVIPPSPTDSLQNQFDRSQVYLYEISKLLQPSSCPRQIVPYAVITYTLDGIYNLAIDAEPTDAEKLANNPQLQLIIKQINARSDPMPETSSSLVTALPPGKAYRSSSQGLPVNGKNSTSPGGQATSGTSYHGPVSVGKLGPTRITTAAEAGQKADVSQPNNGSTDAARLQKVISELNAKLEAEEMKRFALGELGAKNQGGFSGAMMASINSELSSSVRPSSSVGLATGLMPTVGIYSAANLLNMHASISSTAAASHLASHGSRAVSAYGMLKPGLSNVVTSQPSFLRPGFLGNIAGSQMSVASRPGGNEVGAAMATAGYFSFPGATSFFPQNAIYQRDLYPFDYIPTVLGPMKDNAALSAAGFLPIQAINPAAGYAVVGQGVKRPLSGADLVPYVDKRPKFF